MINKIKSTLASNCDRCDNVVECYQLAKELVHRSKYGCVKKVHESQT